MEYQNLLLEKNEGVIIVTLNRPAEGNKVTVDLMQELETLTDELQSDLETRVVVFAGAGKNFCLGAEMADPKQQEIYKGPILKRYRDFSIGPGMIMKLNQIPQITIAAIHGICLGAGTCIASALDFRIGADNCRCVLPENNLGMNLCWLSLSLVVNLVGPAKAKRFVILGEHESARTLCDWGWLDEIVPADRLKERAMEIARTYAAKAPLTTQMIKRSVNTLAQALDQPIMHMDSEQHILSTLTDDFREGIEAIMQKRPPVFTGK